VTVHQPGAPAPPAGEKRVVLRDLVEEVVSRLDPAAALGGPGVRGGGARGRFAGLFGSFQAGGSVLLRAVVSQSQRLEVLAALVPRASDGGQASYPSLTPRVPAASWYERELADLFGILPLGHPRPDPLVLPRSPAVGPPCPGSPESPAEIAPNEAALPAHVAGEGVFTLPYGPVRSGVFESVQFLVETPGEDIPHVRARVYHKHRGIEKRFEGMAAGDGVLLAERVEGVASVAHALAFCQAVEGAGAAGSVPRGALLVRTLHAELERIANHLDSMLRHTEAAGQAVAGARLAWHKETLMRLRSRLCGHRFGRGVVVPGGVSGPIWLPPAEASAELEALERGISSDADELMATSSFVDRLRGTGVVTPEVAKLAGALGPVARGSGSEEDTRLARPYAAYGLLEVPDHRYRGDGDALARQLVRMEEVRGAFALCRGALDAIAGLPPEGPWACELAPEDGTVWGSVEAPQGELLYMVEVERGRLRRVKARSASFHNLSLFPEAFGGDIFTDFAFIEASFGLSVAGVAG
jgi:formate hydrogenlyase subunit 5